MCRLCCCVLCTVSCLLFCAFVCLFFHPVTVVLGVAHPRETAPNTAAHGMASSPTSPRVVANITMHVTRPLTVIDIFTFGYRSGFFRRTPVLKQSFHTQRQRHATRDRSRLLLTRVHVVHRACVLGLRDGSRTHRRLGCQPRRSKMSMHVSTPAL